MINAKLFEYEFGRWEDLSSFFFDSEFLGLSKIPLCGGDRKQLWAGFMSIHRVQVFKNAGLKSWQNTYRRPLSVGMGGGKRLVSRKNTALGGCIYPPKAGKIGRDQRSEICGRLHAGKIGQMAPDFRL